MNILQVECTNPQRHNHNLSNVCRVKEEHIVEILECARAGLLYSLEGGGCHEPLSDADCKEKEMLVMDRNGVGVCVARQCNKEGICDNMYKGKACVGVGEALQYNVFGEVVCGCKEGWGKVKDKGGTCYQHSSKGPCQGTQIVLPSDPSCTQQEVCVEYLRCPAVTEAYFSLADTPSEEYFTGLARLKKKVCGEKEEKRVCCKDPTMVTTAEVEQMILEYYSQPYICSHNHCGDSALPWPGVEGCVGLASGQTGSLNCTLVMREGRVDCEVMLLLRGGVAGSAFRSRCSRGRIWSRWRRRCVRVL